MKKKIFFTLFFVVFFSVNVFAFDTTLFDIRNAIFEESKAMKSLLKNSKDIILMNSMWDSCVMTMAQLDAYFTMLGIFNTIKKENLKEEAIGYLANWLEGVKRTNELNIKSLDSVTLVLEEETKKRILKLKDYFEKLNNQINAELDKLSILKKSLKI
ncbi:MAG: hypothetical protein NC923_06750 [Candidatus Omnitrophica bacterium]|nr:hypothetical protein [Candidatus Omnitrophota bacterium]